MLQLPAIEADLFNGLKQGGIDVLRGALPAGGLSNIAYAKIKPLGGGDSKQALGIMLTCSKQGLPKIAMVFDTDVDIWDDQAVARRRWPTATCPTATRCSIDSCNTMTVDPKSTTLGISSKIGMDCTIPLGPSWNPNEFVRSTGHRPRRSAGRREDHDGRGADQGHGGVHRRRSRAPGTTS